MQVWTLEKLEGREAQCRLRKQLAHSWVCNWWDNVLFVCSNENCGLHCYIVNSEVYIFSIGDIFAQSRNLKVEEANRLRGSKEIYIFLPSFILYKWYHSLHSSLCSFIKYYILEIVLCWSPKCFLIFFSWHTVFYCSRVTQAPTDGHLGYFC